MADKLGLYNGALRLVKERRLAALTDDIPARYHLDDVYTDALAHVLEMGQWAHASASETVTGTASANRGYSYRFEKPSGYVRLISISASSSYYPPLEAFAEDNTYWFSNSSTIYITYVSSGATYGGDLTKWPQTYAKVVEAYLANEIAPHLTKADAIMGRVGETLDDALKMALAKDTINRTSRVLSTGTQAVYNGVLRLLGKRLITNFDDRTIARRMYDANPKTNAQGQGPSPTLAANDVEAEMVLRRLIDECYDDAIEFMLAQGLWNFASRTVAIESSTDVEPTFGYNYVFEKPDDFVRLVAIGANGELWPTLDDFIDENAYWHTNVDPLYVQYISDDPSYGADTSLWTITFRKAFEAYLATQIAMDPMASISAGKLELLQKQQILLLRDARAKDALNQAAMRPAPGRLTQSRGGRFSNNQRREN